jgi:hypothetical protein
MKQPKHEMKMKKSSNWENWTSIFQVEDGEERKDHLSLSIDIFQNRILNIKFVSFDYNQKGWHNLHAIVSPPLCQAALVIFGAQKLLQLMRL